MISFIDRGEELNLLKHEWNSPGAKLIVLYGRRRIGKTTLLSEFFKDKEGIFYISEDIYYKLQVNDLRKYIADYFQDQFLMSADISDWELLFQYLTKVIDVKKRFFLVLDEFTHLVKNDRTILTKLQRFWDSFLSRSNIFLVICGSNLGMIQDSVLSYASPMYGRRTKDILLLPLELRSSMKFTEMNFEDNLMLHMTIGGVPEYLNKASGYKDYYWFIKREFGDPNGYFYREPYFILSQDFKEQNTYFSILNAISYGKNKPSEIADYIGIESKRLYPYLENLVKLRFLAKIAPIDDRKNSGHYEMTDRMMEFWFNFVYKNREFIERGSGEITFNFSTYFGRIFEKFIRDEIFKYIYPDFKIGTWWYKDTEIDIVAISQNGEEIVFSECKWMDNVDPFKVASELDKKAQKFLNGKEIKKVTYHIVAKSFYKDTSEKGPICNDLEDIISLINK